MRDSATIGWRQIHDEVFRRISEKEWKPGDQIPNESVLAQEFNCARATVNRALRQLASDGLLDRRRKGGTRVALNPVRKATLDISITRLEVEARGALYSHRVIGCRQDLLPEEIAERMNITMPATLLHLRTLHLSDERPFMYEDRWINSVRVPECLSHDFETMNANEWLIQNAPYTSGDIAFSAMNATPQEAGILDIETGTAVFTIDRTTWNRDVSVTSVRLIYAPGFKMKTTI